MDKQEEVLLIVRKVFSDAHYEWVGAGSKQVIVITKDGIDRYFRMSKIGHAMNDIAAERLAVDVVRTFCNDIIYGDKD
jgi:hypothetical protein